ncbi:MAG: alpha/beta hydrolase [Pseudomonadota bacterium]
MVSRIRLAIPWFLTLVSLLVIISCGSSDSSSPLPETVPRFECTPCKHALVPNSTTECGYLIVPENHGKPNGKTIKVYVGIFKNPNGASSTEPVFYLIGGPGAATTDAFTLFEDTSPGNYFRHTFGDNRDIVVIDQRGTNNSYPALYCSEELGPLRSQVYGIGFRDAAALRIKAFLTCYNRFKNEGIDLSAFDTFENASDIKDLARTLGYQKINIYSASYGTRLAMQMMKHYPEVIQSVVLDSILPPEINPFEHETFGVLYSFRSFFDAAKNEYPLLEPRFYEMLEELDANPVDVTGHHYDSSGNPADAIVVNVSGDKLVSFLVAELKQTPYDAALPEKINAMYATGDYAAVADAWISNMDFFFPDGGPGSGSPSVGMYNCVFSADDIYYTSPDRIRQIIHQNVSSTAIASYLETFFIDMEPGILGKWPVEPLPFHESDPLVSDIPTLMLVGSLDNATPAIFSEPSAAYLSNSYYFSILAGHSTAYLECVDQMINRFLKAPDTPPENTCLTEYQWAEGS